MPLIEIKYFENEFPQAESQEIIKEITNVMVSHLGENLRPVTWVIVQEIKNGNWGIGGKTLGLDDVRALQKGKSAA